MIFRTLKLFIAIPLPHPPKHLEMTHMKNVFLLSEENKVATEWLSEIVSCDCQSEDFPPNDGFK